MTRYEIPSGSIVVGVDGSEGSDHAVSWAAEQATLENRPLVLLHCSPLPGQIAYLGAESVMTDVKVTDAWTRHGEQVLAGATTVATRANPDVDLTFLDMDADPRETLVEMSSQAHMVVVGSRGRNHVVSLLLGSMAASLVARAHCPVAVVRPRSDQPRTPGIVVGVRLATGSAPVLEHAFAQASLRRLPLTAVHLYFDTEGPHDTLAPMEGSDSLHDDLREPMAEAIAGLGEKYPDVELEVKLDAGSFRHLLSEEAAHHDLVVIGRRSGNRLGRTIGTWSTLSIVEHAAGTVVVVPEAKP